VHRARFFHASASLQRDAVGPAAWATAYTFALVRNPWARQVSMFHFLLGNAACRLPVGRRPEHCDERLLPAAGEWLKDKQQAKTKFRTWIKQMAKAFPPGSRDQHLFGSRSHGNERDAWFNASQISWMVDAKGKLLVDEVFKLEELEAHWPQLSGKICGFNNVPYADGGLKRNPSSHDHFSLYYDDETRALVARYMAADIARFGYSFDEPNS